MALQQECSPALLPRLRRFMEGLGPYQSLVILAVPTSLVEPLKLVALAVAGEGHWITGTIMIVAAYATSLLLVERLFVIVKPKLLTLRWFARLWELFVILRSKVIRVFGLKRKTPA
ncbi:hypothetical protein [Bradyrhizobium sp.]|uniref:hypothetical protein n=1 Tax=Bradyrhizobium sp. TaxID=376 RepID=UPI003C479220